MAATLLTADRSSARPAAACGPDDRDPGEPTECTEAVFRRLGDGRPHTLDELGQGLPVPTRVADEIERLRRYGMSIDEAAGTLIATPIVPLDRVAMSAALADAPAGRGGPSWDTEVVFATGSTNVDLLSAVRAKVPRTSIVRAAELQLAGRGRLGRRWSSAPGASLTASFALTVGRPLSQLDGATLVCGLAVHAVLDDFGVRARLKWPNDVLIDGRKVAGILVEAHDAGESSVLVIGIGINVTGSGDDEERSSDSTALRRTTLAAAGAGVVDRNVLAARLARSLETHLAAFAARGFVDFIERWNAVDAFAGRSVVLEAGLDRRRTGVARGVDDRGALLVEVDERRERVLAGDVSLRPAGDVSLRPADGESS